MIRKIWLLVMALVLLTASACAEDALVQHAVELAGVCDTLAGDATYVSMMAGSGEICDMIGQWVCAEHHDKPRLIVQVDTTDTAQLMGMVAVDADLTQMPEAAQRALQTRLPASLTAMLNAAKGSLVLAASTAITVSDVWASEVQGSGLYILLYENAVPVAASWYAGDDAVLMQAGFIVREDLMQCASAEDVAAWLLEQGFDLPCAPVD